MGKDTREGVEKYELLYKGKSRHIEARNEYEIEEKISLPTDLKYFLENYKMKNLILKFAAFRNKFIFKYDCLNFKILNAGHDLSQFFQDKSACYEKIIRKLHGFDPLHIIFFWLPWFLFYNLRLTI